MSAGAVVAVAAKTLQAADVQWAPHPKFKGVRIGYLLSKKDDGVDITCLLARWEIGAEIPRHIHEDSDDILYILEGRAKVWIEGIGDVPVSAGSFVRIPKGVLHQPHAVEEPVLAHDIFFPASV